MARKWWTLIVVCAATFMLLLDITVVNTALPDIEDDLGASFADLQWVIDAYALTLAAFTLMAGSLADLLGRKRVFLVGIVIFTIASLLCALAGSPTLLNVARAFQGVGGAVMFAVSLALLAQDFRGRELATATAVFGATIGAAVAIGPLVGGALTDAFGWESIFYLNLPIGIVAVLVTQAKVRESRDPQPRPIDWIGVVTFSVALFLLVLALLRGNTVGWGSAEIVVMFIAAAGFLAGFIASQALGREPMLPLSLFRRPAFVGVQLAAFSISASMFALFLYLTLYLQNVLGFSPFDTGVRYLPITLASFIVAGAAGGTLNRIPARFLIAAGLAMVGGGLFLMSGLEPASEWTALLGGFILSGAGVGLVNAAVTATALQVVPRERAGMASGINNTFRQVGIATGTAALGAIFLSRSADEIRSMLGGTPAATGERPTQLTEAVSSGNLDKALAQIPPPLQERVTGAATEGFLTGLNEILVIGGVVCFVGALLALVLVRPQDLEQIPAPGEGEDAPIAVAAG